MNPIGRKIYHICLTEEERHNLQQLVDQGQGAMSSRRRAQILLLADTGRSGGGRKDADIADIVGCGLSTVERARKCFVEEGMEATIERKHQENRKPRLLDGEGEAQLTMLACSQPPEGRAEWTLQLLGERLVELRVVDRISKETVRRTLKKTI